MFGALLRDLAVTQFSAEGDPRLRGTWTPGATGNRRTETRRLIGSLELARSEEGRTLEIIFEKGYVACRRSRCDGRRDGRPWRC